MENLFHYYNHHQPASSSSSQPLQSHSHLHKERRKVGAGPTPKRGGSGGRVKLSTDPQSVAARERRHRISDRFRILKSLVPGGSKMDTVSMLEEAIHYVKFLKAQIWLHQAAMLNYCQEDEQQTLPSTSNTMTASLPPHEGLMLYNSMVAPSMHLLPIMDHGTFQGDQHDGGFNY